MPQSVTSFRNSRTSKLVFLLSILVSACWCIGQLTDVYHFAFVGAIFEIVWLPVLGLLIALPIVSLVLFGKERFNPRSLYLYSAMLIILAVLIVLLIPG